MPVGGGTIAAGVIGTPIRHSLSPAIFNAAFMAVDLDWTYLAFEVAVGDGPAAVAAVRALGLGGLSVTMPHKEAVVPALDRLSDDAAALGAVNCIARDGEELVGHNTDGAGLVDALRLDEGIDPTGLRCVVVGAGGAGRAVVRALAQAGAAEVAVLNRTADRAEHAVALAGDRGRIAAPADLGDADLVVNATSIGMGADRNLPIDIDLLGAGQVVVDLIYHPGTTELLAAAGERGLRTVNGLGMLVHQAGHAFRHWTGAAPPLSAMRAGALAALALRGSP